MCSALFWFFETESQYTDLAGRKLIMLNVLASNIKETKLMCKSCMQIIHHSYIRYIKTHRFEYLWEHPGALLTLWTVYAHMCSYVCSMHIIVSFHFFHIFMSSQCDCLEPLSVYNSISSHIFVLYAVSDFLFKKIFPCVLAVLGYLLLL